MDINSVFESEPSVYQGSEQTARSEVALFQLPPTDLTTQLSSDYTQSYPVISVKDSFNPVEFQIVTDSNGYLDPLESYLAITCRIVQQDGTVCTDADKVAPCNLFFQCMFSNLELYLNGQLIQDTSNFYPWMAYMQRLLSSSPIEKQGKLRNELWYPETEHGVFKESDLGWKKRFDLSKKSQPFTMLGQILANVLNQPRYLPAGSEIRIVLRRNLPESCLTCETDTKEGFNGVPYKYEILDAVFYGSKKVISKPIIEMHRQGLAAGKNFLYPISEYDLKTFSVSKGLAQATTESAVIGKIPRVLLIGFVDSEAFMGKLSKSPFNYTDLNLSELSFTWNGEQIEYRQIPFSFSQKDSTGKVSGSDSFLIGLRSLQKTAENPLLGNGIDRDNYRNGNVLTAIELLPNSGNSLSVNRRGQVKISMRFKDALKFNINVVVFCLHQSIVEINKDKQVILDH